MSNNEPQASVEVALSPAEVLARVPRLLEDKGYVVVDGTDEEFAADPTLETIVTFAVKRSMFRNALIGLVQPKAQGTGSLVEIYLSTAPGENYAVMDKRRNKKTAVELAEQLKNELQ